MAINLIDLWKNKKVKFFIGDCESEGLNLVKHRPWQLSYLIVSGGKIKKTVDNYIWFDDLDVSEGAKIVTKFDYEKYKSRAISPEKVVAQFEKDCQDAIFVGHNILGYDVFPLNRLYQAINKKHDWWFMKRMLDTNALSKILLTERKNNDFESWEDFVAYQMAAQNVREKGVKSSQLAMLKYFNIPFDEHKLHDALYDVQMNALLLEQLIYKLKL